MTKTTNQTRENLDTIKARTKFDIVYSVIINHPHEYEDAVSPQRRSHLRDEENGDVLLVSFCPEGFVGIGVPIGSDVFVQNFVVKTCMTIIDDVEKLDAIQDNFIHYQLLRFYQTTRLQYINSHILFHNRCVLYMFLHLPDVDGGFGVTFNYRTRPHGHHPRFCCSVTSK
jgi:hypothetical protein